MSDAAATTLVQVGDNGLEGVAVQLRPYFSVEGKIRPDPNAKIPFANIQLVLTTAAKSPTISAGAQVRPDGTFTIPRVQHGPYHLTAMVDGWVVDSVIRAGQTAPSQVIDLSSGPARIEVVMHNRPGIIEASVPNAEPGTQALACEVHSDQALMVRLCRGRPPSAFLSGGKFRITNLRPAKYRVIVMSQDIQGFLYDPDSFAKLLAKASEVTISSGATVALSPRLVGENDVN